MASPVVEKLRNVVRNSDPRWGAKHFLIIVGLQGLFLLALLFVNARYWDIQGFSGQYWFTSLCIFGLTGLSFLILLLELALFFSRHFPVGLAIFFNTLFTILWVVLILFYWLAQSNGIWALSDPEYTEICADPAAFLSAFNSTHSASYSDEYGYSSDPLSEYDDSNLTDPHGSILTQLQHTCEGARLSVSWFPLILIILVLIFYLSILSCVTCSRNRTRRRWTKFVSRNPGYAVVAPPPAGASSVNIAELREHSGGGGVGGGMGAGAGREVVEGETVLRDGVAYRWALVPTAGVVGQGQGGGGSEDMQMAERRRDRDMGELQPQTVAGPQEAEGLVIGRAATPLRETFEDHSGGTNIQSRGESEEGIAVVR
ncbi:uncharacterized protein STEHIDRAFT_169244 [Stereum hirsutum FP-91666 SS1]|uniref:uncharacterized protein n=1 Tax=Stereum hirsutum (strain FP-91666) TaxID=721885 RepID=UPI0004449548|nr:uncharacterized protein STEHIDRAFT_169244 [Stereum hirsutum FP-91666 SS1]EIM85203.1 hypothetical protein STEHIDRAFT_169244 [Stereum hirsutum FP-91666 SS1]